MNGIWVSIGTSIWNFLEPKIEAKFNEWLPKFIKAILLGVSQAAGQLAINTEDKITDILPGQIDDEILDPLVARGMEFLNGILGK